MREESRHWTHTERFPGAVALDSLSVRRIVAIARPREGWLARLRRAMKKVSDFLGAK